MAGAHVGKSSYPVESFDKFTTREKLVSNSIVFFQIRRKVCRCRRTSSKRPSPIGIQQKTLDDRRPSGISLWNVKVAIKYVGYFYRHFSYFYKRVACCLYIAVNRHCLRTVVQINHNSRINILQYTGLYQGMLAKCHPEK